MRNRYISDTHFSHANIIHLCDRPFGNVQEMNGLMLRNLREAEAEGARLYHLGDVAWGFTSFVEHCGWLERPQDHVMILGNHDKEKYRPAYEASFGQVVGTRAGWRENHVVVEDYAQGRNWRVLLSHAPQQDLRGCDLNLYGHHHDNLRRKPEHFAGEEWRWLRESSRHINVSVEVIGYRPRTLDHLLRERV